MTVTIRQGDCRDVLRMLPAESVHCVVTSPPYFGLRDYGTAKWDGGDPSCDHQPPRDAIIRATMTQTGLNTAKNGLSENQMSAAAARMTKSPCPRCGARRIDNQIGLEPTPEAFVAELVAVFRAVRRVLRADGTCWLNLGDSYASSTKGSGGMGKGLHAQRQTQYDTNQHFTPRQIEHGVKDKDLLGIPWRVAFALQADGWYLRQDIIWSKPNPMPESVRDRCTKAHEYLFLLSKSERYHYDAKAIAEQAVSIGPPRRDNGEGDRYVDKGMYSGRAGNNDDGTRNRRSVWEVTTEPFPEAHFATFPSALIEPCILAGCPKGGTVLDPFGGAGTTGLVADRLGRNAILIELNPTYAAMAERRIKSDAGMFANVSHEHV